MKKSQFAALMLSALVPFCAHAGQYADALGECVYKNLSASDKTVMTQWAYVTIGKTKAAKQIAAIPDTKISEVNSKARQTLIRILGGSCAKEAASVALYEPKDGIKNSVSRTAYLMVEDEVKETAASLLPGNVLGGNTELLQQGADLLKGFLKK